MTSSRRALLSSSALAAVTAALPAPAANLEEQAKLRILIIGAHPGDPEAGCGGTIARYVRGGHTVTNLYLTRGEGGIRGKTAEQAAQTRTAEADAACKILG